MAGYAMDLRNAQLDAITDFVGPAGKLQMYDGTQPATGAAITDQTLLAELTCGSPFAPPAFEAQLSASVITQDSSADASGTVTWGRIVTSADEFCIDVTAGVELIMENYTVIESAVVSVASLNITRGNS